LSFIECHQASMYMHALSQIFFWNFWQLKHSSLRTSLKSSLECSANWPIQQGMGCRATMSPVKWPPEPPDTQNPLQALQNHLRASDLRFYLTFMAQPTKNQNISLNSRIHNSLKNRIIHKVKIIIHSIDLECFSCEKFTQSYNKSKDLSIVK